MSHSFNGRSYTASAGTFLDVAQHDAQILGANGWMLPKAGAVGATRPANPTPGDTFIDSAAQVVVIWDAVNWRSVATGAVA